MKRSILLILLSFKLQSMAYADPTTVPPTMEFAGIHLKITTKARKKIQADVDALTSHPNYFQTLLDRINLWLPIVEEILKKE